MAKVWSKWRDLTRVIYDKKVQMKVMILIPHCRPYGCETWPMSAKDERLLATTQIYEDGMIGNGCEPTRISET